jgi:Ca2+-binding RTX toxin-like protein
MRATHLWLLSAVLIVGFVALASPVPLSAINTCATNCNCTVSCSTECLVTHWEGVWPDRELVVDAENCGEYGVCIGSASCPDPSCPAQSCTNTINGTAGNDTLNGGSARDCIYGFGGNDTIDGNAGDDHIYCGAGTDTAYGDSGHDCLYGEGDGDYLDGESGTDLCDGGAGTDTCSCEANASCP